ncbi:MAG: IS1634 family transposase [Bacillota bacterium]
MWIYHDAEAPMISGMCRSLGITQAIDEMVEWEERQYKLSPGLRVEAMIVNILMGRKPLYRLHEFFEDVDVSKIFDPGIEADDWTDDAMARALDKLAAAGPEKVYGAVALAAASREGVDLSVLHADTTSVSVQGVYEDDVGEDVLSITWGYSKQSRPDLKQFLLGIGSTKDQIPLIGEVLDGNTSDHEWARGLLCRLSSTFKEDVVYVADSSLVSKINLEAIAEKNVKFISRIPASFLIAGELKERAWEEGSWEEVGALSPRKEASLYKVCSL